MPVEIRDAVWPDACPHPEETHFLSVVVGNTSFQWAVHRAEDSDYRPEMFWRTTVDSITPLAQELEYAKIVQFLPAQAHRLFHQPRASTNGDDENATPAPPPRVEDVVQYMVTSKRIPSVTIYVISTNAENEEKLTNLFEGLACRFIRLKAEDFYATSDLPYKGMGLDRLAAARAIPSFPALILDGGTALTVTAIDAQGKIIGGGIAPGLQAKFRAMHTWCHDLPEIKPEQIKALVQTKDPAQRLPVVVSTSTEESMMSATLRETALYVNAVACDWYWKNIDTVTAAAVANNTTSGDADTGPGPETAAAAAAAEPGTMDVEPATTAAAAPADNPTTDVAAVPPAPVNDTPAAAAKINVHHRHEEEPSRPRIYLTGSDGGILSALLGRQLSNLLELPIYAAASSKAEAETTTAALALLPPEAPVKVDNFLCHRGIQRILLEFRQTPLLRTYDDKYAQHVAQNNYSLDGTKRLYIIGQRIAKDFGAKFRDENGDSIFRGIVVLGDFSGDKVFEEDLYTVIYDDGDTEDYDAIQLYDALLLYSKVGEKKGLDEAFREASEAKQQASATAAAKLAEWSSKVGEILDYRELHPTSPVKEPAPKRGRPGKRSLESTTPKTSSRATKKPATQKQPPAKKAASKSPAPKEASAKKVTAKKAAVTPTKVKVESEKKKPGPKKATPKTTPAKTLGRPKKSPGSAKASDDGESYVGRRVAKSFDGIVYYGTVKKFMPSKKVREPDLWKIVYDDDDKEDYDRQDLMDALEDYEVNKDEDPQKAANNTEEEKDKDSKEKDKEAEEKDKEGEEKDKDSKEKTNGDEPAEKGDASAKDDGDNDNKKDGETKDDAMEVDPPSAVKEDVAAAPAETEEADAEKSAPEKEAAEEKVEEEKSAEEKKEPSKSRGRPRKAASK